MHHCENSNPCFPTAWYIHTISNLQHSMYYIIGTKTITKLESNLEALGLNSFTLPLFI